MKEYFKATGRGVVISDFVRFYPTGAFFIYTRLRAGLVVCLLLYITIEKYTIFQLKSIPVLIVCEDKKSYLNAG